VDNQRRLHTSDFNAHPIEDYNGRRALQMQFCKGCNSQQSGDPAKLAQALLAISNQEKPPHRFIAGADAIGAAEKVVAGLQQQITIGICRLPSHLKSVTAWAVALLFV